MTATTLLLIFLAASPSSETKKNVAGKGILEILGTGEGSPVADIERKPATRKEYRVVKTVLTELPEATAKKVKWAIDRRHKSLTKCLGKKKSRFEAAMSYPAFVAVELDRMGLVDEIEIQHTKEHPNDDAIDTCIAKLIFEYRFPNPEKKPFELEFEIGLPPEVIVEKAHPNAVRLEELKSEKP